MGESEKNLFCDRKFVKKFGTPIVPIYIERTKDNNFKLKIHKALEFSKHELDFPNNPYKNEIVLKFSK